MNHAPTTRPLLAALLFCLIALCTHPAAPASAAPLASAFTYQGQLTIAGPTSTGPVDLQFRLFDAATGGTQIGPTITSLSATIDAQGRFTTTLDFGATAFGPEARWLEVSVRRWPPSGGPGGPDGGSGGPDDGTLLPYTTLSPRTAVSPSPATLFAMSSISARGAAMFTDATTVHEFTVPEGVYAVRVDAWGAGSGGGQTPITGGGFFMAGCSGSAVRLAVPVRPGDVLRITLGTAGTNRAPNASGAASNATSGGDTIIERRRGTETIIIATVPGGKVTNTPAGQLFSGVLPTVSSEVGPSILRAGRVSGRTGGASPFFAGRLPEADAPAMSPSFTVPQAAPPAWSGEIGFSGEFRPGNGCVMLEY